MSETRATYNVTPEPMQPGRELDALVARVLGWRWLACMPMDSPDGPLVRFIAPPNVNYRAQPATGDEVRASDWDKALPYFSTEPAAAMEAWGWLQLKRPWGQHTLILLGWDWQGIPAVFLADLKSRDDFPEAIIRGETEAHAIALAVCEAGRVLGVIE